MSVAQSVALIDKLVRAKMPRETATELLDFVEQNQAGNVKKDLYWIKIMLGFTLSIMIALGSLAVYLHSDSLTRMEKIESSLKPDMKTLKSDMTVMETRINKRIDRIEQKIDRLLEK